MADVADSAANAPTTTQTPDQIASTMSGTMAGGSMGALVPVKVQIEHKVNDETFIKMRNFAIIVLAVIFGFKLLGMFINMLMKK